MGKQRKYLLIALIVTIALMTGCSDTSTKVSAPIEIFTDSGEKFVTVGNQIEINFKISALKDGYLNENIILVTLHDAPHSKYSSPFDGNMLNIDNYFDIISVSDNWKKEKISDNTEYEIIEAMRDYSPEISQGISEGRAWLLVNNIQENEDKELNLILKSKSIGKYTLVVSHMNAKTGFVNICVGNTNEEAQRLCEEYLRSPSTTEQQVIIETNY